MGDEVGAIAARLSAICFVAVLAEDLECKILLGRFAHDEALLLRHGCGRLAEITAGDSEPRSLREALGGRSIDIPDVADASFLLREPWSALPAPLCSDTLFDEPTHRYRNAILDTRERQASELRAVAKGGGSARSCSLDELAAALANLGQPGRPPRLRLADEHVHVGVGTGAELAALLQQNLVNLEIPTIEMCCSLIVEEAGMPLDFAADMARQAWDEARHARMFWDRLLEVGGRPEDHPASTSLWRMCRGRPLAVRLAIHQCCGEWIGVDGAAWYQEAAKAAGDSDTAALFEAVMCDEMGHVRSGHRWLEALCPTRESRAAARAAAAEARRDAGKVTAGALAFPLRPELCRACGFNEAEIAALAERYEEHGSKAERPGRPAEPASRNPRIAV